MAPKITRKCDKMKKQRRILSADNLTLAFVCIAYGVTSYMVYSGSASRQMTNMLISISCYIVMALCLNLVVGLLGELSLGHASFMSVGLFSGCMLSVYLVQRFPDMKLFIRLPVSMIVGGIVASVFGLIVGLPALRLDGDYLAIVTLACGEIIKSIITNLKITGGARGIDTSSIYSKTKILLPYAFVLVIITILVMMNLKKSKYGRAIQSVRDNKIAAESCGINVVQHKLSVFVLSAFFAGCAGTLYGHNFANVKASSFDYNLSIEFLLIVVLGGLGSVRGSVIAAIVLRALPEALRGFDDYRMLVYSVLLIFIMLFNSSHLFDGVKNIFNIKKAVSRFNKNTKLEDKK